MTELEKLEAALDAAEAAYTAAYKAAYASYSAYDTADADAYIKAREETDQ